MSTENRRVPVPELPGKQTEVRSIRSPWARSLAASFAEKGLPVGSYNRGVCAIWGDGANPNFPEAVARIKGELRGQRPLAASLPTERFVEYIDLAQVPPSLRNIFKDAQDLAARTGSLCFFRAPITESAAADLPTSMVSRVEGVPIIQNWDPKGHRPTHKLLRAFEHAGIQYPAVTSMNISGQPELTDQTLGIEFSKERQIPIFLSDDKDPHRAVGSYTILGLSEAGLELVREGNIPSELLKELLGHEIATTDTTSVAKGMQPLAFQAEQIRGVHPRAARIAILSTLNDHPTVVTKTLLKAGRLLK